MPAYYDKARKRWRYEFDRVVDGRRQRTTKMLPQGWSATQAQAYAAEHDRKTYALATGAQKPEPLISEAVRLYVTEHAPTLKNSTKLIADLALCFGWYEGRRLTELPEVVREYAADNPQLKPATVRLRMAYLRAACRWAWKRKGLGDHDPAERVTMPKVRNERHHYLTRAQVVALARSIKHRDVRACVLIAFYSGMRQSEILRAQATPTGWLLADTKNGERRLVPIHPRTAHLARRWPCGLSRNTLVQSFRRNADAMGWPHLRFHDLRHSTASALLAADVDLYTVGGILGHKSTQSTRRYAHLANATLAKAIGAL